MIAVPVFDRQGNPLAPVEVDEDLLGGKVRKALLREAIQMYETNRHVCTKSQLSRGEVAGTTRKMYRQKHTGSARAGQRTVAHRRGGGRAFPSKSRDISYHIPKKARKSATRSALLARLLDKVVSLLDELPIETPKTRVLAEVLEALGVKGRCLLVIEGDNGNVWTSGRNLKHLSVRRAADLNAYDLLVPDRVVFTQAAFKRVLEALGS